METSRQRRPSITGHFLPPPQTLEVKGCTAVGQFSGFDFPLHGADVSSLLEAVLSMGLLCRVVTAAYAARQ